jgi:citrate synthase
MQKKMEHSMVKAGLEDIVAAESAICDVNGAEGRLIFRGYDIHDLADNSTFEEVVYLLWFGRLPKQSELEKFEKELRANMVLPKDVVSAMKQYPKQAQPMEVLRTTTSLLSMYDPDDANDTLEATIRKATRLIAQLPVITAYFDNIRNGRELKEAKPELNIASNFLYLLTGKVPDEISSKSLDVALVLHADHELNASTFAARVAAATLTDIHSAVVAAIGTLKGPLHGGANQEVIKMLLNIKEPDKAQAYIQKTFADHQKVMGFGHRVYKTEDPRAHHLRIMSEQLGKQLGDSRWYEISRQVEETVRKEKGLYANVDFYSASVYYMLGIPVDLFTPIFAMSRMSGWAAHIFEQLSNNRLIRPRAEYTGERNLKYVPMTERKG